MSMIQENDLLKEFDFVLNKVKKIHHVEVLHERVVIISPKEGSNTNICSKKVALSFMGLTHGDEIAGIYILLEFLYFLLIH